MVPLEGVDSGIDSFLRGFYQGSDTREEIDATARSCAAQLASGDPCTGNNNDVVDRVHFRQFGSPPAALNGTTRIVLFTWYPSASGGPSVYCDAHPMVCGSTYPFKIYNPDGSLSFNTPQRLDHVVNFFDIVGSNSGWVSIWNIPDIAVDLQIYGFALNSANPPDGLSQSWDAIFEAYIIP